MQGNARYHLGRHDVAGLRRIIKIHFWVGEWTKICRAYWVLLEQLGCNLFRRWHYAKTGHQISPEMADGYVQAGPSSTFTDLSAVCTLHHESWPEAIVVPKCNSTI